MDTQIPTAPASTAVVCQSSGRHMPPEELALQSLCKQLFKSRLFRGYYDQRCHVDALGAYRDIIILQRSERELEKLLLDTKTRLLVFYYRMVPNMWIGVTNGNFGSYKHVPKPGLLETCLWVELNDLAFGEYWFSVKSLRFRDQEVLCKLKMIRPVEAEPGIGIVTRPRISLPSVSAADSTTSFDTTTSTVASTRSNAANTSLTDKEQQFGVRDISADAQQNVEFADFVKVLQDWGDGVKTTVYNFMANDINKTNIIGMLKFLGLLVISLLSGAVYALRFLGIFMLRFMFEFSRFTHVATPIIFKMLELLNKVIGGIFILITMIWKDVVVNRGNTKQQTPPAIQYETQLQFRSIEGVTRRSWRNNPTFANVQTDFDASNNQ